MIAPISQYLSTAKVFQFLANTLRGQSGIFDDWEGLKRVLLKKTYLQLDKNLSKYITFEEI